MGEEPELIFRFGFDFFAGFLARSSGQFLADFRFLTKFFGSFRHQLIIERFSELERNAYSESTWF